jgi:DNA-3-methyladenine glycosylase II
VTATVSETGEQAAAREAYAALGEADPAMHRLLAVYGAPDAFAFKDAGRTAGNMFGALVLHILSQQISTRVAFVLYDRLAAAGDGQVLPEVVLRLGETGVRGLGTSQAKASYVHGLARSVSAGDLDLKGLKTRSDREAAAALTAIRGIGDWTAQMFLIYQLRRPDILPAGDMGSGTPSGPPAGSASHLLWVRWSGWEAGGRHTVHMPQRCYGCRCGARVRADRRGG